MAIYTKLQLEDRNINTYFPNSSRFITALAARGFNQDFIDSIYHYIDNTTSDFGQLNIWDNRKFGHLATNTYTEYLDTAVNINSQGDINLLTPGVASKVKVPTHYTVGASNDLTDKKYVDAGLALKVNNTVFNTHTQTLTIHRVLDDAQTTNINLWSALKISNELTDKVSNLDFNNHINNPNIHHTLNDAGVQNYVVWSAAKIISELGLKTNLTTFNAHANDVDIHRTLNDDITNAITLWSGNKISSLVSGVQTNLNTHTGNLNIHRAINDAAITVSNLWSATKINSELGTKADASTFNTHINNTGIHTLLNDAGVQNYVVWSASKIIQELTAVGNYMDKGSFTTGTGINLSGTLSNRLLGLGNVTIALDTQYLDERYLNISNNLSDLSSAATARTNLGLTGTNNTTHYHDTRYLQLTGGALTGNLKVGAGTMALNKYLNIRTAAGTSGSVEAGYRIWKPLADIGEIRNYLRFTSGDASTDNYSMYYGGERSSTGHYNFIVGTSNLGTSVPTTKMRLDGNGTLYVAGDVVAYSSSL